MVHQGASNPMIEGLTFMRTSAPSSLVRLRERAAELRGKLEEAEGKYRAKIARFEAVETRRRVSLERRTRRPASRASKPCPPEAAPVGPMPLKAFAEAVMVTARGLPKAARFGPSKVFLSRVYDARFSREMNLDAFHKRSLEAMRHSLIILARADLVGAMNERDVRRSEATTPDGAAFHFVRI